MNLGARMIASAMDLARMLAVVAALAVALNLPPAHAHAVIDPLSGGQSNTDCADHGLPSSGETPSSADQRNCSHHFHPLFDTVSLSLDPYFFDVVSVGSAELSQQVFHSFDPPPPRQPG